MHPPDGPPVCTAFTRRPGTALVGANANQTVKPRLRRFQFSTQQGYMLSFAPGFVDVYRDDGHVVNIQAVTGAANNGAGVITLKF